MNYKRLNALYHEVNDYWFQMHGFYLDAITGFMVMKNHITSTQERRAGLIADAEIASETFQDTTLFSYDHIFSNSIAASSIHMVTQGEVKRRNSPDGLNYALLGRVCVVSFYTYWDGYLRREWALAKGVLSPSMEKKAEQDKVLNEQMNDDFWGDMRLLRRSIIHHGGRAIDEIANAKLIKWFKRDEEITRNDIHSDSLPKRTFRLPMT
jgi:hypothetical protein